MKISKETLKILKNYSVINQSILFREGNMLSTINPDRNVISFCKIDEYIPLEFAVYNLNSLLSVLSVMGDVDVTFDDTALVLSGENTKMSYHYTPMVLIQNKSFPEKTLPHVSIFDFELNKELLTDILKISSIIETEIVTIKCDGEDVSIILEKKKPNGAKNFSSDNYCVKIGNFNEDFEFNFNIESFSKLIPDSYRVSLSKSESGKSHFLYVERLMENDSDEYKTKYWIAIK